MANMKYDFVPEFCYPVIIEKSADRLTDSEHLQEAHGGELSERAMRGRGGACPRRQRGEVVEGPSPRRPGAARGARARVADELFVAGVDIN